MAIGTDFGGIHSNRDLQLIQQKVEVAPAEPKMNMVEIPGTDGSRDLSDQPSGRVTFNDRKITWTFALYPGVDWDSKHRQVSSVLNGRSCQITLDTDPEYYYQGRLAVRKYNLDGLLRQITVEAICRPYILKRELTRVFVPFGGKNLINPASLVAVAGSGVNISALNSGLRIAWRAGAYSYTVMHLLPLDMLIGKTITLSSTIDVTGSGGAYLRLGYASADASVRTTKVSLTRTGKVTLKVTREDSRHEWLALWAYANNGTPVAEMTTEDYVDYTNLQLELGGTATAYEVFTPDSEPQTVTLSNERMPVVPTVRCTGATELAVGGSTYQLSAGNHTILDFELAEGATEVTLSGAGAAAIIYQEGSL